MENQVEEGFAGQVETMQKSTRQAGEASFAAANGFGDSMRAAMEKTLHETRARFDKSQQAMAGASAALETSLGAVRDGVAQFNTSAMETMKADAQAQFEFVTSMFAVKSLAELTTLSTEFVRKRAEDATARAKTVSEFARKVGDEIVAPVRAQMSKTLAFAS